MVFKFKGQIKSFSFGCICQGMVLTVCGVLTHGSAGLAGSWVPGVDLDLDAVPGHGLQVGQNHTVLLYLAHASGLQGATER